MAARRGNGGWSLIVFFGLWVGLAAWWMSSGNAGTGLTIVKGFVLVTGLFGLAVAVLLAFILRKLSGAVEGIKGELVKGMGPEIDDAARKLVDLQEALFDRPHEYQKVDPAEFDRLDGRYYDDTRDWLAAQGFVYLADVENVTLSRAMPSLRTFLRVMAGDGGETTAAVYQVRLDPPVEAAIDADDVDMDEADEEAPADGAMVAAGNEESDEEEDDVPAAKRIDALEFETELSDGTFLVTNGLRDSDKTADAAGIDKLRLPAGTPRETVLAEHRRRVAAKRGAGATPRSLPTFDDVMASQARLHELKVAHQRQVGYFNEAELSKTGGGKMFAKEIAERAKQIYAERRAAAAAGTGQG
jgi:hypothetical protein